MFEVQIHRRGGGADESFEAETMQEAHGLAWREADKGDFVRIIDHESGRVVEEWEVPARSIREKVEGESRDYGLTEGPTGVAAFLSARYR
jgi:hypothetical protein